MNEANAPRAVAIIMDGNRRYARKRGCSPLEGHARGYEKLKEVLVWSQEAGVLYLTVFAFSTENWKRTPEEVSALMDIFRLMGQELEANAEQNLRVRFIGDRERFPSDLTTMMARIEAKTESYGPYTLAVAVSYGGRNEIVRAAEVLREKGEVIDEAAFAGALMTAGIPDPDLIIRTGGDKRISNFLLWQAAYSELFFLDTEWPALSHAEFDGVLQEFARRERRFGT